MYGFLKLFKIIFYRWILWYTYLIFLIGQVLWNPPQHASYSFIYKLLEDLTHVILENVGVARMEVVKFLRQIQDHGDCGQSAKYFGASNL